MSERYGYCGAHNGLALAAITLVGAVWAAAGAYAIWILIRGK